jgi:hypothetical protein
MPLFLGAFEGAFTRLSTLAGLSSSPFIANVTIKGACKTTCFQAFQSTPKAHKSVVAASNCASAVVGLLMASYGLDVPSASSIASLYAGAAAGVITF